MESEEILEKNKNFIYSHKKNIKNLKEQLKTNNYNYYQKSKSLFLRQMKNQLQTESISRNQRKKKQNYISSSLSRTKKNLVNDLEISSSSIYELKKSGQILKKTMDHNIYIIDDSVQSKKIIKRLDKKEVWNKILNFFSFFIFSAVAFYVFNKRIPVVLVLNKNL